MSFFLKISTKSNLSKKKHFSSQSPASMAFLAPKKLPRQTPQRARDETLVPQQSESFFPCFFVGIRNLWKSIKWENYSDHAPPVGNSPQNGGDLIMEFPHKISALGIIVICTDTEEGAEKHTSNSWVKKLCAAFSQALKHHFLNGKSFLIWLVHFHWWVAKKNNT